MLRNASVAGQMLALQAVAVLLAVLGVTPVLAVYDDAAYREVESRRALSTAETLAGTSVLQLSLAREADDGVAGEAERVRSVSGAVAVEVRDAEGRVRYASDPARPLGEPADAGTEITVDGAGPRLIAATVPVLAAATVDGVAVGDRVGTVTVARDYPPWWTRLGANAPALITYVLVGAAVGLVGSLLVSRRIKQVTFGLEPREIRGMVEHREAMLHGLREGVVGVDMHGRVTVVNDEATRLLSLPDDVVGRDTADLDLDPLLVRVLRGEHAAGDLPVARAGRMLVLNQMPAVHAGEQLGWVTTVRDRTEHVELARQVAAWRDTTDVLRAQAHEFSNRMHTVAGLVELGEYDDLAGFLASQRTARQGWTDRVLRSIDDRPLAALLVAKGSQAAEKGVHLELDPASSTGTLGAEMTEDLLTVVGNLLDNAFDEVAPRNGHVRLLVVEESDGVRVEVEDDGPGLAPGAAARIFESGFSTKADDERTRGWGLALCRMACEQRGGSIRVAADEGRTRFVAHLPTASARGRTSA